MTTPLRLLVWSALLVGWLVLLLDWRDEVVKLRPERTRLEQLRAKEQSALWSVDWQAALREAKQTQTQWLARLPSVEQTGVFRAQSLEGISDLCRQLEAPCQISALGENVSTPSKANSAALSGVITTGVRVGLPTQDSKLELLINALENDSQLRRIDKITTSGGRVTMDVQIFGIDTRPNLASTRSANEGKQP
jgi:hypothetical protein